MSYTLKALIRPASYFLKNSVQGHRGFKRWVAPTLRELQRRKDRLGPEPPIKRSDFIEWNYNAEIYAFGKRLSEDFSPEILKQAFIEESFLESEAEKQMEVGLEPNPEVKSNLEMSSQGEILLQKYTHKYLKTTLPRLPEKYILEIQDFLLSTDTLAHISKHIGIDDLVLSAEFPPEEDTLARSFKSVVHALVLSSGEDKACIFIRDFVLTQLAGKDLSPLCTPEKPLEELAAVFHEAKLAPPEPRLIAAIGRNTIMANYQVGIYSDRKMMGKGFGESVETAQDMAACDVLWKIWGVSTNKKPFPFNIQLALKDTKAKQTSVN